MPAEQAPWGSSPGLFSEWSGYGKIRSESIVKEKNIVMAITDADIKRINELARKSRTPEGLTEEEKAEQSALRMAYVAAFRESLKSTLDATVIQEPDGTRHRLTQKEDPLLH